MHFLLLHYQYLFTGAMIIHLAVYVPISTEAVQAQKLHRKENMQQTAYSVFNPFYKYSLPFVKIENI